MAKEITAEDFDFFLDWLCPDDAKRGEAYERLRFRLVTFFAHRNCRFPEELADEVINRTILKISGTSIENKLGFCYGIAKNVFLESLRKEKSHQNIDEVVVADKPPMEEEAGHACLDKCLKKLPDESRRLILEYYSEEKQAKIDLRQRLMENLALSQAALRMKVMRIRDKLRGCIEDCIA